MEYKRATLVVAFLFLFFFVSTSSGFANLSLIQEKLREVQIKIIGERIKQIQERIYEVGREKKPEPTAREEPQLSREELAARLDNQIKSLEELIKQLKPRLVEEGTARLEQEVLRINQEMLGASAERLRELQDELRQVVADYALLQQEVKKSLEESIRHRQALVLQEQLRVLQAKIGAIPTGTPAPVPVAEPAAKKNFEAIQAELERVKLKLLQTQAREIQASIDKLRGQ